MLLIPCSTTIYSAYSQEIQVDYIPPRIENILETDYNRGKHYLVNTYKSIKERKDTTYIDYWNVATAYSYMGQPTETILAYFEKAKKLDPEAFCDIASYAFEDVKTIGEQNLYKILGAGIYSLISVCDLLLERRSLESRITEKYDLNLDGLNVVLIDKLISLMHKDQYYRYSHSIYKSNWEAQNILDAEVSQELVQIFKEYGYPGKKLVGENYMNYGCLLLEHGSNLKTQETYFPLIVEALENNEVAESCVGC